MNTDRKKNIIEIVQHPHLRVFLSIAIFFTLLSGVIVALNVGEMTVPVILHFDALNGADRIGEQGSAWYVWALFAIFAGLSAWLAEAVFFKERILSHALLMSAALVSFLSFVALATIASIN
jgi:hypothetical protein